MAAGDLRLGEQVRVQVERLAAAHAAPARGLPRGLGGHRRGEVLHAPGLPGTALGEKYLLSTVSIKNICSRRGTRRAQRAGRR